MNVFQTFAGIVAPPYMKAISPHAPQHNEPVRPAVFDVAEFPPAPVPAPNRSVMYEVMIIDQTMHEGYRVEAVMGYGHYIDARMFKIMVGEPRQVLVFNWLWVLGFRIRAAEPLEVLASARVAVEYLYDVTIVDSSRVGQYRSEYTKAWNHAVGEHTLQLMMIDPKVKLYYNWKWVLNFSRKEVLYGVAPEASY